MKNKEAVNHIKIVAENGNVVTYATTLEGAVYRAVNFAFTDKDGVPIRNRPLELNGVTRSELLMLTYYLAEHLKQCEVKFSRDDEQHVKSLNVHIEDINGSFIEADIDAALDTEPMNIVFEEDVYWAILHASHIPAFMKKPLYTLQAVSTTRYGAGPLLAAFLKLFS